MGWGSVVTVILLSWALSVLLQIPLAVGWWGDPKGSTAGGDSWGHCPRSAGLGAGCRYPWYFPLKRVKASQGGSRASRVTEGWSGGAAGASCFLTDFKTSC